MTSRSNSRVLFDIRTMTNTELEETYGITIEEDGSVWDSLEGREFESLLEWADYTTEQEEDDHKSFLKTGGRYGYDDD